MRRVTTLLWLLVICPQLSTAGLVLHYEFSNNFLDSSGFNNNGTPQGAGVTFAPGMFGQAASFAGGEADFIRAEHSASLNLSSAMTLSAWIRPNVPPVANGGVIFKGDINNSHGVYDLLVGSFPSHDNRAGTLINNGAVVVGQDGVIPFNEWQHLASTYDGANLRLYLDGVEIASAPFVGTITQEVSPLNIGHRFRFGDGIYSGLIDDVRIYDHALSASEISDLANAVVPEPSTSLLLALGGVMLFGYRRRAARK